MHIKVIQPSVFALLKLKSWCADRSRTKDLRDFYFITFNYFEFIDAEARIYATNAPHRDLLDLDNFDFTCAGAQLLGRDLQQIDKEACCEIIEDITSIADMQNLYETLAWVSNIKTTMAERIILSLRQGITKTRPK